MQVEVELRRKNMIAVIDSDFFDIHDTIQYNWNKSINAISDVVWLQEPTAPTADDDEDDGDS